MEFFLRARRIPSRIGILPGTFNPITLAHLALAEAALPLVDEVVFVLPRSFPHKHYTGANFEQRVEMLTAAVSHEKSYSVAATGGGLFEEIARECNAAYGSGVRLSFLCGRDAAERIVSWDYDRPGAVSEMLKWFDLLVAARGGEYTPPPEFADSIAPLAIRGGLDFVSSTEVRRRIARCEPWEHLVPPAIAQQIRNYYL